MVQEAGDRLPTVCVHLKYVVASRYTLFLAVKIWMASSVIKVKIIA
jgi:hypothetical protein